MIRSGLGFFLNVIVGVPESEGIESDKHITVFCGVFKDTSTSGEASAGATECTDCSGVTAVGDRSEFFVEEEEEDEGEEGPRMFHMKRHTHKNTYKHRACREKEITSL